MSITPAVFPTLLNAVVAAIEAEAEAVTELDQALGDGDHVFNLQRGLQALQGVSGDIANLAWPDAWQKIGMTVMASVGGASGSLYATLFISIAKYSREHGASSEAFAEAFVAGVEAMKLRGKAGIGEKTMLDVLIPVAQTLQQDTQDNKPTDQLLQHLQNVAEIGVESTRDMLATKGRASFLGERSKGQIDAGAKTAQLMIDAISTVLLAKKL